MSTVFIGDVHGGALFDVPASMPSYDVPDNAAPMGMARTKKNDPWIYYQDWMGDGYKMKFKVKPIAKRPVGAFVLVDMSWPKRSSGMLTLVRVLDPRYRSAVG